MVGIAFPGTFILDPQGRVTSRFFEDFYIERNTVSSLRHDVRERCRGLATASPWRWTSCRVAGSMSTHQVRRTIVSLHSRSRDQPAVRLLPVEYPESEIYFFEPLNERVPVY